MPPPPWLQKPQKVELMEKHEKIERDGKHRPTST